MTKRVDTRNVINGGDGRKAYKSLYKSQKKNNVLNLRRQRLRLKLRLNNLESQLHKIYMLNKFGDDVYNDDSVSCCSVVKCNDKKKNH